MPQNPLTCKLCDQPRKPRTAEPGRFFTLCVDHFAEYKKQKDREYYLRTKAKRIQIASDWNKTHPERHRTHQKAYEAKPEYEAYQRQYYRNNKDQIVTRVGEWAKENRDKTRAGNRRYVSRKRSSGGRYTEEQLQARIDFYGRRCYLCGCDWDALPREQKHIDHVIPVSLGGTNWPANLRPACRSCNQRKSARMPDQLTA